MWGRLKYADVPFATKHPILLPKNEHFTRLIIESFHLKLFHSGVPHTLSQIRQEFWIPAGRAKVYHVIHKCKKCKKFDSGPYELPPMPSLPAQRVLKSIPFSNTGLDYLGPLYVKTRGQSSTSKTWICLFTCLVTRAIHLEVVEDLTAEQFLLCLQRFIGRRGKPSVIYSDNGGQFKLIHTVCDKIWSEVICGDCVTNYISSEGIKWMFITEKAPWMGGVYERLVRQIKQCLKKSLGKLCLSVVQLQTLVVQIEAVLNSRPLTYVGSDIETGCVLTPGHFLSPNYYTGMPAVCDDPKDPEYFRQLSSADKIVELWKKGQRHDDQFWKVWKNQYLLSLREKWQLNVKQPVHKARVKPKLGDIVQIYSDSESRGTWKLAKIKRLITSKDGNIRSVAVSLSNGNVLTRSIGHLYPLECSATTDNNTQEPNVDVISDDKVNDTSTVAPASQRPARESSKRALANIRKWTLNDEH
jgi:hypothetical protein